MDHLRATLGCSSDADVFRFLDSAGNFDYVLVDLQNRQGSRAAPVFDRASGICRRPATRIPT
eukprot:3126816-Lingulodinium_polyedra.AAC.1